MKTHYSSVTQPGKLRPGDVYIMDTIPDDWVLDKIQGEPDAAITIKPLPNRVRTIHALRLGDRCSHLIIDGLQHLHITGVDNDNKPLVEVWGHHLILQHLRLNTNINASTCWTSEDWEAYARKGLVVRGGHVSLIRNCVTHTSFAIELYGGHCRALQNDILHFCGDAIRGLNNNQTITGNLTAYAHAGNPGNHLDHIQLWNCTAATPQQGALNNMIVSNNYCYNPTHYAPCQGIGCYDGTIGNSTFEGNVVGTNHPHLLTLASAQDCAISNNQLYRTNEASESWLMLGTSKPDHAPSAGNAIYDNQLTRIVAADDAAACDNNQPINPYAAWQLLGLRTAMAQESI